MKRNSMLLVVAVFVAVFVLPRCAAESEKSNVDKAMECLCTGDSPLIDEAQKALLCGMGLDPCSGMTEQQCDEVYRWAYQSNVGLGVCDPIGGAEDGLVMETDTTTSDAIALVGHLATGWDADSYLVTATCHTFYQDGTCRWWELVYRAPDRDKAFKVNAVKGLAVSSREGTPLFSTKLAEGWLNSDRIAATAWQNKPDQVDHTSAMLLVTEGQPKWAVTFTYYEKKTEGNSTEIIIHPTIVEIDALTGNLIEEQ